MRKHLTLLLILIGILLNSATLKAEINDSDPVKIACVGNSITFGSGIANREKNAFPQQLQAMLGMQYDVRNFGVSGRTLLKKGDYPYWETETYNNALLFKPDIVYIKLGTNDSKLQNRIYLNEFEANYMELIANFKKQNGQVRIVILLLVPSFLNDSASIWNPVIKDRIIPVLQKIAYKTDVELLDLYQLFIDKQELLPDKIHPSSLGATVIAKRLYENIMRSYDQSFDLMGNLKVNVTKESDFFGFQQFDFQYKDNNCKIVKPKKAAIGNPWVLRARFWAHEPQTDIALLERGFHVVYCDVANLFGAPEAVKRWNKFYGLLTKGGLSKKVVLEGMSRGGLIVYNWAAENPEKVACVYADAPVLDSKSWPGGKGKGKGSPADWVKFKEVYGLDTDKSINDFSGDPIHKTGKIAKAGFPMMHVCGEVDKIVPVKENSRIFEGKIKSAGGDIFVIYKKDVGHHPHSLGNPTPVVNFILRATGYKVNFADIPAPGSEYRSGAGWKEGKGWWGQANDIDSLCGIRGKLDLLLIGNSITQSWGANRSFVTTYTGRSAADIYFKDLNWLGAGISGDRTEHILWRIKYGNYNSGKPKVITLAIGVNNFSFNTAEEIAKGLESIIALMKVKFTDSEILFYGPLPTGQDKNSDRRIKYNEIHGLIEHLGNEKSIHYYNMLTEFSDEAGNLNELYYSGDGIHLKADGYYIWGKHIKEQMEKFN